MRKLLAIIMFFAIILPSAALSDIDVASMTDKELKDIISICSDELRARATIPQEWVLLFDCDTVQVYQTDEAYIGKTFKNLYVPIAVINDMDYDVIVSLKNIKCNGWEILDELCGASAKSKKKEDLSFNIDDAFVDSIDQITSFSFQWCVIVSKEKAESYYKGEIEEQRFW